MALVGIAPEPPREFRFCRQCLHYEGMHFWLHPDTLPPALRHVHLDDEGVCNVCRAYKRQALPEHRAEELRSFLEDVRGQVTVLFSGGKDSAVTLVLARELGLDVRAMLFDNGHIPAALLEQADAFCRSLGVSLRVKRMQDPAGFRQGVHALTVVQPSPCIECAGGIERAMLEDPSPSGWYLKGTNYFERWIDRPRGVDIREEGGKPVKLINLPYVMGLDRTKLRAKLSDVGYTPLNLPGISSNCHVPALVQERVAPALGHVPELEDLALEVLVGHVARADAVEELRHKAKGVQVVLPD